MWNCCRDRPIPEVVDVVHRLGTEAKIAVASGGLTEIVRKTLQFLGSASGQRRRSSFSSARTRSGAASRIRSCFCAAELLGVEPKRCLVFEDAEPGFDAAKAAGMDYIDVRDFRRTGM